MSDLDLIKQKMNGVVDFVKGDISTVRTGKANPGLIENIMVNVYGGTTKMRIMEVGSISSPEPTQLVVSPYDPSIIGDIRKDLEAANLGVVPVIDNNVIRLSFPPLSAERRMEYVKLLHVKLEDGRVKIRQVRHDKMSELKRSFEAKEVTEDDRERIEIELQKITDSHIALIEEMGKNKEKELLTV